jgi:hypothetical protein
LRRRFDRNGCGGLSHLRAVRASVGARSAGIYARRCGARA